MRTVATMVSLLLCWPVFADPPPDPTVSGSTREEPAIKPEVQDAVRTPPGESTDKATLESFRPSETVPAGSAISFPADI